MMTEESKKLIIRLGSLINTSHKIISVINDAGWCFPVFDSSGAIRFIYDHNSYIHTMFFEARKHNNFIPLKFACNKSVIKAYGIELVHHAYMTSYIESSKKDICDFIKDTKTKDTLFVINTIEGPNIGEFWWDISDNNVIILGYGPKNMKYNEKYGVYYISHNIQVPTQGELL